MRKRQKKKRQLAFKKSVLHSRVIFINTCRGRGQPIIPPLPPPPPPPAAPFPVIPAHPRRALPSPSTENLPTHTHTSARTQQQQPTTTQEIPRRSKICENMDKNRIEDRVVVVWSWGGGGRDLCLSHKIKTTVGFPSSPTSLPPTPPQIRAKAHRQCWREDKGGDDPEASWYVYIVGLEGLGCKFGLLPFAPPRARRIFHLLSPTGPAQPTKPSKSIPENVDDQDRILPPPSLVQRKKRRTGAVGSENWVSRVRRVVEAMPPDPG